MTYLTIGFTDKFNNIPYQILLKFPKYAHYIFNFDLQTQAPSIWRGRGPSARRALAHRRRSP
jgi:hypothetical protein